MSIAIAVMAMLFLCNACHRNTKLKTDAIVNREAIPVLEAHDVNTLISDSGVTRYRITAPRWTMYDKAKPPYWEFEQGVYLEKFDENLNVNASLKADYAYYNETDQIWRLFGNVHSLNLEGEQFDTQELYWNQKQERVYSDSAITIRRASTIIYGIGFESNQEMTKYIIKNPTGVFPIEE